MPTVVWQTSGGAALLLRAGFIGSWIALFYSLSLTGLGYQTGLTEWWHWVRRRRSAGATLPPGALISSCGIRFEHMRLP